MAGFRVKSAVASIALVLLPACSTVIRTSSALETDASTEVRAALKAAAADLAWSPWPKPEDGSFAARFASTGDADRMTRDRAVEIYLASAGAGNAAEAIAADARRHLVAADVLADVAEQTSDGAGPRLSDVAVLEASIADLRETRAIYVAALKKIEADGKTIDAIRDPLDAAVKRLGRIADELAESAMKKRASEFAGPNLRTAGAGAF